jgi:hypothetical protein
LTLGYQFQNLPVNRRQLITQFLKVHRLKSGLVAKAQSLTGSMPG